MSNAAARLSIQSNPRCRQLHCGNTGTHCFDENSYLTLETYWCSSKTDLSWTLPLTLILQILYNTSSKLKKINKGNKLCENKIWVNTRKSGALNNKHLYICLCQTFLFFWDFSAKNNQNIYPVFWRARKKYGKQGLCVDVAHLNFT